MFSNERLPTLDTELWLEEPLTPNPIRYSFFRKPLSTPFVVMESIALSWDAKRSILSQEVIRRGLHLHPLLPDKEKVDVFCDFETLLRNSGYSWSQIREIMMSGLVGLEKKL